MTNRFYDLTFIQQADGSIRLMQKVASSLDWLFDCDEPRECENDLATRKTRSDGAGRR